MLRILKEAPVTLQQLPPIGIPSTTPQPQFWNWRSHRIAYSVVGTGQPLILIHGFGAAIGHWRNNIPALAAAGYQVFALDLLGFGASDKPALDYSLDLWAELLADFWTEQVQQPVVWIGNSIGALLSLIMAARYPHLTRGAILLNCAGGLNHRPEELNFPLRLVMGLFTRLVRSEVFGGFLFNRVRQKSQIRATLKQVYRNPAAITDELVEIIHAPSCDPGARQVFAAILTAPPGPQPAELLPQVSAPLLVLWGEEDPWTPVSGGKIFQQPHPQAAIQFISIPATGHCPHDERPEQVNALMLDWLQQQLSTLA